MSFSAKQKDVEGGSTVKMVNVTTAFTNMMNIKRILTYGKIKVLRNC